MVEAAVALPVFVFIVLNGLFLLLSMYRILAFETLVSRSLRTSVVDGSYNRLANLNETIERTAQDFSLPLAESHIVICPEGNAGCEYNDAGGCGDFLRLTVTPVFDLMPGVRVPIGFSLVSRNEPF